MNITYQTLLLTAYIDFYFIYTKTFPQMKSKTERKVLLLRDFFSYPPHRAWPSFIVYGEPLRFANSRDRHGYTEGMRQEELIRERSVHMD